MDLSKISDVELLVRTKAAALREREATLDLLKHLREVELRMLYALNYSSLFEYCVGELGYDGGAAHNRIAAMRLLRDFPEFESKAKSGELSMTVMSQIQTFCRKEKVKSHERKREIVNAVAGMSSREAQRELLTFSDRPEIHRPEYIRPVSEEFVELRFLADQKMMEDIEKLRAHLGVGQLQEILRVALHEAAKKRGTKFLKAEGHQNVSGVESISSSADAGKCDESEGVQSIPAPEVKSESKVRREVFRRDGGQCTYYSAEGKRCNQRARLEFDHIHPKSKQGQFTVSNLRLRCRTHNQWAAIGEFGLEKMAIYLPHLRAGRTV